MKIRKITNISKATIPVVLNDANGTTVYLPPKATLENKDIVNQHDISSFVRTEMDLSEIGSLNEKTKKGKKYLKG